MLVATITERYRDAVTAHVPEEKVSDTESLEHPISVVLGPGNTNRSNGQEENAEVPERDVVVLIDIPKREKEDASFEEMVIFRYYTTPSTRAKYLVVKNEGGAQQTRLLTHTPLTSRYASEFFEIDYQTWWKKTHGDFLGHHLQTLMNIIGSTTTTYLGNSNEVPINEALITDVPPSSNARLSNQYENERSHTPSVVCGDKAPTQTTHVSKGLPQDKNESRSRDLCNKRVKVHFDDGRGTSPLVIEIHNKTNNPLRTIPALIEEGNVSQMPCFKRMRRLERHPPFRNHYRIGKKKELCRKVQVLESLLAESKNEAKEARLETSVVVKEFDARFDADLSNGVDQKKEHLEAMRQDLINYKLCLD
ncbi:hypothetical protein BC332_01764 [Capsicum chinense]|nr:hypothetical protein BC332_01764 [Capsicum chinense]